MASSKNYNEWQKISRKYFNLNCLLFSSQKNRNFYFDTFIASLNNFTIAYCEGK